MAGAGAGASAQESHPPRRSGWLAEADILLGSAGTSPGRAARVWAPGGCVCGSYPPLPTPTDTHRHRHRERGGQRTAPVGPPDTRQPALTPPHRLWMPRATEGTRGAASGCKSSEDSTSPPPRPPPPPPQRLTRNSRAPAPGPPPTLPRTYTGGRLTLGEGGPRPAATHPAAGSRGRGPGAGRYGWRGRTQAERPESLSSGIPRRHWAWSRTGRRGRTSAAEGRTGQLQRHRSR